jgi:putative NADH-flavin reductase
VKGADVVVGALSPRGELDGKLRGLYAQAAKVVAEEGARWVVVGGFGSLRPAEGADRIARGDDFPAEYAPEARVGADTVDDLHEKAPEGLDWLFISPAANYGSYAPGEKRGSYRVSGDVALFTEAGESAISGVDYATALVDEIETPKYSRAHIGFVH